MKNNSKPRHQLGFRNEHIKKRQQVKRRRYLVEKKRYSLIQLIGRFGEELQTMIFKKNMKIVIS